MDQIIYNDCPRHSLGEPKRPDQLERYFRNQCVYCGSPKPADLLGPACEKTECQGKRWAEVKLTEKQMIVLRGLYDGKPRTVIAREMGISSQRVKELARQIARRFDVRDYNRTLVVRCYCEWQDYLRHQTATSSPPMGTPLKRALRTGTARK
jgi:DNA-binding CsgD family transcriptional regulator